jgi:aspartyl-tRNA synthetase
MAERLRIEYVVAVEGTVRLRPKEVVNARMATGFVEVVAESIQVLNQVHVALPFLVTTADDSKDVPTEEVRLRYRHLDLRRPQMNRNLRLRHSIIKLIRRYLEDVHDFIEVCSFVEGTKAYSCASNAFSCNDYTCFQMKLKGC